MTFPREAESPPSPVFRIGRAPDPWEWPPWEYIGHGRWDDSQGEYRVLYASSERLTPFLEVLAQFRPDPAVVAAQAEIEGEDDGLARPGELEESWILEKRRIGAASIQGEFAVVGHSRWLAYLRDRIEMPSREDGDSELDAAAIRSTAPAAVTRKISHLVSQCRAEGKRHFQGIAYESRHGDEFKNWAIFEPATVETPESETIAPGDKDLATALELFQIRLV